MSLEPREYLRHIRDEADYLSRAGQTFTFEQLLGDEHLQRAFRKSIEILGEAAKKVPPEVRARYPDVEWSQMARMRDRLTHGYFSIDYSFVWAVAREKAPDLKRRIEAILDEA